MFGADWFTKVPESDWQPPSEFPDLSAADKIAVDLETKKGKTFIDMRWMDLNKAFPKTPLVKMYFLRSFAESMLMSR